MVKVKFRWISRAKFNAIPVKDVDTIYFIYNEHVLYKGNQEYGGVQAISYTSDSDNNYIISITNGDGTVSQLQVASSSNINRLKQAVEILQSDLESHIETKGDEDTSGHVQLTDTIDDDNLKDVEDNTAVTPKAVSVYVTNYQGKSFLKYPTYLDFPVIGKPDIIYLALDTNFLWFYNEDHYELMGDNWRTLDQIQGIIS